MATRRRHPIFSMPFDDPVANDLEAEYRGQAFGRRFQARRKAWAREAMLVATGQARLQAARVPASVRAILWVYSWTTVGDAILDLAPRRLVPKDVALDLLIAPALAPLFATDARFREVHVDIGDAVRPDIDFVFLDSLRTGTLGMKRERFSSLPFATLRGHQSGERFDRAAFADRRLRQLFALPAGSVEAPRLDLGTKARRLDLGTKARRLDLCTEAPRRRDDGAFRLALALGARVPRKLYRHWGRVLGALFAGWPHDRPALDVRLVGQGDSARVQQGEIERLLAGARLASWVDHGDLRRAALDIASCDAFLGVDGGLMHVAVAVGTPGLALFTRVDPAWFLRPNSSMQAMRTAGELDAIEPDAVASAFLAAVPAFRATGGASD